MPIILLSAVLETTFYTAICEFSVAKELLLSPGVILACTFLQALTGTLTNDDLVQQLEETMGPCANAFVNAMACKEEDITSPTQSLV